MPQISVLDAAFVFMVSGSAFIWPPLALLVGAAYLVGVAVATEVVSRRKE